MKQIFHPEIWLVERREFNPGQWLDLPVERKLFAPESINNSTTRLQHEVEVVLRRIEVFQIDLTCTYEDWLKMGFAFADEFGEMGRSYFHRLSRFNSNYNFPECDLQFTKCIKGKKTGITIKTFFAAAKEAGINVRV
jgi:hypothetical protein